VLTKKRLLRVSRRCVSATFVAELELVLISGDRELGGGVNGEVEEPSDRLEGIWRDVAMKRVQ
jgi:hypothetical protein